jgi:hypothetical protein
LTNFWSKNEEQQRFVEKGEKLLKAGRKRVESMSKRVKYGFQG